MLVCLPMKNSLLFIVKINILDCEFHENAWWKALDSSQDGKVNGEVTKDEFLKYYSTVH